MRMSASGGNRAIIAAFLANMGIAVAKFIAWLLSGSASMLAEAIHSVADSGNQLLLLFGGRRAKRKADREHPFGYGRERYIYAFLVSIILFSVGGLFSIYEGVEKITNPHELENLWIPIAVLLIAIVARVLLAAHRGQGEQPRPRRRASRGCRSCGTPRRPSCPSCCSRMSARSSAWSSRCSASD